MVESSLNTITFCYEFKSLFIQICFKDGYILLQIYMKFKLLLSDSDLTLYNIYNLSF